MRDERKVNFSLFLDTDFGFSVLRVASGHLEDDGGLNQAEVVRRKEVNRIQRHWGTQVGKSSIWLDEDVGEESDMTPRPAVVKAADRGAFRR